MSIWSLYLDVITGFIPLLAIWTDMPFRRRTEFIFAELLIDTFQSAIIIGFLVILSICYLMHLSITMDPHYQCPICKSLAKVQYLCAKSWHKTEYFTKKRRFNSTLMIGIGKPVSTINWTCVQRRHLTIYLFTQIKRQFHHKKK